MANSTLVTNIISAMQTKINAWWTIKGFPGSAPTISDLAGMLSAMFDTTDTYEATVRAPLPQSAAGVGQWLPEEGGSGIALQLPSGGTWAWSQICWIENATNIAYVTLGSTHGGINAGGTTIMAGYSGYTAAALVWRILASPDIDPSQPVELMSDGSYVVTLVNGYPYNVPDTPEFSQKWQAIQDWLAAGNTAQPYVPPVPTVEQQAQIAQMQARASLSDMMLQYVNSVMVGPTAPKNAAAWLAAWKAAGLG